VPQHVGAFCQWRAGGDREAGALRSFTGPVRRRQPAQLPKPRGIAELLRLLRLLAILAGATGWLPALNEALVLTTSWVAAALRAPHWHCGLSVSQLPLPVVIDGVCRSRACQWWFHQVLESPHKAKSHKSEPRKGNVSADNSGFCQ
jgi:hypothetical protein